MTLVPEDRITIPLLRKVVEHIEAEPEHFAMGFYKCWLSHETASLLSNEWNRPVSCGTAACIAGTTVLLCDCVSRFDSIATRAQRLLGLTSLEATELFCPPISKIRELEEHPERVRAHVESVLGVRL